MNLSSIIDQGALNFTDKIALVHDGNCYPYDHLKNAVDRIALGLEQQKFFKVHGKLFGHKNVQVEVRLLYLKEKLKSAVLEDI